MRDIAWNDPALAIRGALDLHRTARGLSPRRLPAWTAAKMLDPSLAFMARMTSGVRLALRTNAKRIELDVLETGLRIDQGARVPAVFDLRVDGVLVERRTVEHGNTLEVDFTATPAKTSMLAGVHSTLTFDLSGEAMRDVDIWLPQSAGAELLGLRISSEALALPPTGNRRRWAHYGSSISHGMEAAGPSDTWPAVAARRAGVDLTSLGFAGQCHLDGVVARVLRDCDADLISLKLGINVVNLDSMRERVFIAATNEFLDTIRADKKTTPILVVSPIICPAVEDHPGPTLRDGGGIRISARASEISAGALTLRRIRDILTQVVEYRRRGGDVNLHYLDGLCLFDKKDTADLPDGLPPNARGQVLMGERFAALTFGPGGAFQT